MSLYHRGILCKDLLWQRNRKDNRIRIKDEKRKRYENIQDQVVFFALYVSKLLNCMLFFNENPKFMDTKAVSPIPYSGFKYNFLFRITIE